MDILSLIKNRSAVKRFKNKPVSRKILNKIIEAGIWGPSIHGFQSWKFVVIENKILFKKLIKIIVKKMKNLCLPSYISIPSIKVLASSPVLICIINDNLFSSFAGRLNKKFAQNAKMAELSSIAAAIQNMILVAENNDMGTCWLDTPLFLKKEIEDIIGVSGDLVAVLTVGYPLEKRKRSLRKDFRETVTYI